MADSRSEPRGPREQPERRGDVQSVVRALDLLELVGRAEEVGVSELAREAGLAVSTTHSLVRTLARRHYLVGVQGRYRLGPAVAGLSAGWDPVAGLRGLLGPVLDRLAERAELAATATVLIGREARIIHYSAATGPITVTAERSAWSHPLRLATGRVMVALGDESAWPEFIANDEGAEPGWSQRRWLNEFRAISRSGVALKRIGNPRGTSALAVPVWTRGGSVAAAIGCSAPTFLIEDLTRRRTLAALWDASGELSAHLGCDDPPLTPALDLFDRPPANQE
ncbi:IclR family transcriptional regulator [Propionibacteriaceae bacterium Y2011]